MALIQQITQAIASVDGIQLLNIDPGRGANRTVVTFAGEPAMVVEAAFKGIKKASELIDMRQHKGTHPRFGATDVCPLIPVHGITMEELVTFARQLGERVGKELGIHVYLYEYAAFDKERSNLSLIRAGEYESLAEKIRQPGWQPDFGPAEFNARSGAVAIGARKFLAAYNVNLNTTDISTAKHIAGMVRESGNIKKNEITGKPVLDNKGIPVRVPGTLKAVKAIGWHIDEYGKAQVSLNLTDMDITPVHIAFDEVCRQAAKLGVEVTGSELVGMIPLKYMLSAGRYFLHKQNRSVENVPEAELVEIAVDMLGLSELSGFDPANKIIEYCLQKKNPTP